MAILDLFKSKEYENQIFQLESEIKTLNTKLKNQISESNFEINKLKQEIDLRDQTIKSIRPLFDIERSKLPGSFESLQTLWMKWGVEIQKYEAQILRQERACSDLLTPLDLNVEQGQGHFRGKIVDYLTTLTSCECVDFQRRLLPCKHMYRLAYEFDVFMLDEVQFNPDIKNLLRVNDVEELLAPLTASQKNCLRNILDHYGSVIENTGAVKTLITRNLIQLNSDKRHLLDFYKKDELHNFLPDNVKVPRNIKKADLMELILSTYPDVISNIEKFCVDVRLHKNIQHLFFDVRRLLSH